MSSVTPPATLRAARKYRARPGRGRGFRGPSRPPAGYPATGSAPPKAAEAAPRVPVRQRLSSSTSTCASVRQHRQKFTDRSGQSIRHDRKLWSLNVGRRLSDSERRERGLVLVDVRLHHFLDRKL